ncbi:cytochrome d ubiquinol oxidase subunit II [Qingshengfaniella alkalisoli]|uniref:Cytochrome d ubiquinol oxidase subunit II n=1 Tax=Qingshengfaniella alkalisoli TaxID=2599296 RepID=A0A5B8IYR2_9RHOB|nr:cytochrome d ubiquinol oxidase subunit II [Qingshengfaniella alkalisoli]QDY70854.1 cytochrome d ubiquinol oxidase subunit II [Qingshengfaniella alkalisoli]
METGFDITAAWALILAVAVYIYVVLDGFDLGIGILYPLFPGKRDRDLLMNTVAPVWDGNETWLVLGGGGLFAAFPLAYAILMPAVYPLVIAMLLGLVFRGVAFEFRWKATGPFSNWLWDTAFFGGSFIAAMSQGMILGAILQGIEIADRSYAGGWWDWLTPFTLLCGAAVVCGYMLLGACWLNIKTSGDVQVEARRLARILGIATVGFIVAVSLWTPFLHPEYLGRWFAWPAIAVTAPVPIAVALLIYALARSLTEGESDWRPFLLVLALFLLCFIGLGISMWPWVIPTQLSIWDAATARKSQIFMLVGVLFILPIILGYTAYAYWVFRGKVDPDEGYH